MAADDPQSDDVDHAITPSMINPIKRASPTMPIAGESSNRSSESMESQTEVTDTDFEES